MDRKTILKYRAMLKDPNYVNRAIDIISETLAEGGTGKESVTPLPVKIKEDSYVGRKRGS